MLTKRIFKQKVSITDPSWLGISFHPDTSTSRTTIRYSELAFQCFLLCSETKMQTIPSTYFIHHPVSIFNGSFNDLLDSHRIIFISMDFETLQHSKCHRLVNTTVVKIKIALKSQKNICCK